MRWVLLFFGSLAAGVLAIVLSLALLLVSLSIYVRYVLGIASNGAVGWDPVSIFGRWVIGEAHTSQSARCVGHPRCLGHPAQWRQVA